MRGGVVENWGEACVAQWSSPSLSSRPPPPPISCVQPASAWRATSSIMHRGAHLKISKLLNLEDHTWTFTSAAVDGMTNDNQHRKLRIWILNEGLLSWMTKNWIKVKKMRPKIKRASNCWAKKWGKATSEESKKVSNQKLEKWKLLLKWGKKQGMAWGARKEVRRCLSSGTSVGKSLREPRSPWSCSSSSSYLQWAQVSQRHIKGANANENKERNQQTHTILIYRVKRNKRNKTPPCL